MKRYLATITMIAIAIGVTCTGWSADTLFLGKNPGATWPSTPAAKDTYSTQVTCYIQNVGLFSWNGSNNAKDGGTWVAPTVSSMGPYTMDTAILIPQSANTRYTLYAATQRGGYSSRHPTLTYRKMFTARSGSTTAPLTFKFNPIKLQGIRMWSVPVDEDVKLFLYKGTAPLAP